MAGTLAARLYVSNARAARPFCAPPAARHALRANPYLLNDINKSSNIPANIAGSNWAMGGTLCNTPHG